MRNITTSTIMCNLTISCNKRMMGVGEEKDSMIQYSTPTNKKYRLTAFIDPILVKRAKVRGTLEGLTMSQVVERALEAYAPKIEKDAKQNIHLKFTNAPSLEKLILVSKHTKNLVVPR